MTFLEEAEELLAVEVDPRANQMDGDPEALREALGLLCRRGWMALKRPAAWGGPELNEQDFRAFQELVARHSGALAFLQTQHQSAVSLLAKADEEELKAQTLPLMSDGRLLVGLGFSQLRRPGPPILTAEEAPGGYRLKGRIPWITGLGAFHKFIVAATLPEGTAVFGLCSFIPGEEEGITFGEPMKLAAVEAAQTVGADVDGLLIPHSQVLFFRPQGWIARNDMINIVLQGWFALGCARAGIDVVEEAFAKRKAAFLQDAAAALEEERQACRAAMARLEDPEEARLQTRAWSIDLAARCAHAGVAASSGAASSAFHRAQRVYREAMVFTVSAQTSAIMEATLARLVRRGGAG